MRMRVSKRKGWKSAEVKELRAIVDTTTNKELCAKYNIDLSTLQHAFSRFKIKRSIDVVSKTRSDNISKENNPMWKGGISKDTKRYSKLQRERYPERKHARDAVYRALKAGRLVKPTKCSHCGHTMYLEGHHMSYEKDKWLDVVWLCKPCHNIADKGLV